MNPRARAAPAALLALRRAPDDDLGRAAHLAAGHHLDALDLGRVHRERPLHPDPEGKLSHRERAARAGALLPVLVLIGLAAMVWATVWVFRRRKRRREAKLAAVETRRLFG